MRNLLFLLFFITESHLAYSIPLITNEAVEKSYFSGLNIGLSAGLASINYHHYDVGSSSKLSEDHKYGSTGFSTALSGSFLFPISTSWLLGPELHIQYNPHSDSNKGPFDALPGLVLAKYSLLWNSGIAAKLGYAIDNSNLIYLLIGPEMASMSNTYIINHPASSGSHNKEVFGGVIGIGSNQRLTKHIYFGEQVNYGRFESGTTYLSAGGIKKDYPNILSALIYLGIKI